MASDSRAIEATVASAFREVRYECSQSMIGLLADQRATLLVSTYQAGKLAAIGVHRGELTIGFHNFERPMGVARSECSLAVGTHRQIWLLDEAPHLAPRIEPAERYQTCFLARSSHWTDDIQCHEMAWIGGELWIVNTLFSCLCTLSPRHSFVPRWQPPFISELAAEDRCHLNGLAVEEGRVRYVTALGETDEPRGWRAGKASGGCLIEVPSGHIVARGFCMPHSPRVYDGQVWLLDSGAGRLISLDRRTGRFETVAQLPGYLRGLSIVGGIAFIGLSKIRDTATFGGVPLAENREQLKCGVAAVDLRTGHLRGTFEFHSGVSEIFDVSVLANCPQAAIRGPACHDDGHEPLWVVPSPQPFTAQSMAPADVSSGISNERKPET
jgi:uncharacterized protein (TIGR03032 family)